VISEFVSAIKHRVSASVQSAVLFAVAGVIAAAAVGFFIAALHTWLAIHYGSVQASLALGGGLLVVAIIIMIYVVIMKKQAAARMKRQQDRLLVQPAAMATTLMSQFIGAKQTSVLMLVALAAGFLMARPRRSSKE
jgi:hypothetical protein